MTNNQAGIFLLLVTVGAGLYLYSTGELTGAGGNASDDDSLDSSGSSGSGALSDVSSWFDSGSITSSLSNLLSGAGSQNLNGYDSNLSAFLYMLRMGESSNRYNVINGGATFSDYSQHPDKVVPPGTTTAAGAYQFVYNTWTSIAAQAGLPDFSPSSQDAGAVQYLSNLGAMSFIESGDIAGACAQINSRGIVWQALPGGANGGGVSLATLQGWYSGAGGSVGSAGTSASTAGLDFGTGSDDWSDS